MSEPVAVESAECLVVLYGEAIGKKYVMDSDVIAIGRDIESEITLDAQHVSRHHARIWREDEQRFVEDLGSTNGTYVNDSHIKRQQLDSGDLIQVGEVILKYLADGNIEAAYHEEIYKMAITDGLTSVPNKRYLSQFLEREFARAQRHDRSLSLLFFDLDHFKEINTRLGHVGGDLVLREFAQLIFRRIRRDELFARYGGEEFVAVLPESDFEGARRYAEILRARVEEHAFIFDGDRVPVTVSIGVSSHTPEMETPRDLIRAADMRLREAKRLGRNQVVP